MSSAPEQTGAALSKPIPMCETFWALQQSRSVAVVDVSHCKPEALALSDPIVALRAAGATFVKHSIAPVKP